MYTNSFSRRRLAAFLRLPLATALLSLALGAGCSQNAGIDQFNNPDGGNGNGPNPQGPALQLAAGVSDVPGSFDAFYEQISELGYNEHMLRVVEDDGTYHVASNTLNSRGYTAGTPRLAEAATAAADNNIKLIAEIEVVARRQSSREGPGERLDNEELESLMDDLATAGVTHVAAASFPSNQSTLINSKITTLGGSYQHLTDQSQGRGASFGAIDYNLYPRNDNEAGATAGDITLLMSRLGVSAVTLGHGLLIGRPVYALPGAGWAADMRPGFERSLLAWRAVDNPPAGWGNHPGSSTAVTTALGQNMVGTLATLRQFTSARALRPLCNLVVLRTISQATNESFKIESDSLFTSMLEAATNAISMAGYDLRVSYDGVATSGNYEAYYVLVGHDPQDPGAPLPDLPGQLVTLLRGDTPVVFHPAGPIPNTGGWMQLRDHFGIASDAEDLSLQGLPSTAMHAAGPMRLRGFDLRGGGYRLMRLPAADVTGDVTVGLSGDAQGEDTAFVLSRAQAHFVNINILHLEASVALAGLLGESGDALQAPFFGYVSTSDTRVGALAVDSGNLVIEPPGLGTSVRVRIWDSSGDLKSDEREQELSPLTVALQARELAIIER